MSDAPYPPELFHLSLQIQDRARKVLADFDAGNIWDEDLEYATKQAKSYRSDGDYVTYAKFERRRYEIACKMVTERMF